MIHRLRPLTLVLTALPFLLAIATPAAAQNRFDVSIAESVRWTNHQRIADNLSTFLVGATLAGETVRAFRSDDRKAALVREGVAVGLTVGLAELTKRLVHRTRPDRSDRLSFFSEHTALAFVPVGLTAGVGWSYVVNVPIGFEVGALRVAANKHWASDVLTGAAVGWLSGTVARRIR
jgi:membrane-associated phospholipid phosphatase